MRSDAESGWWPDDESEFVLLDQIASAALAEIGLDAYTITWEIDGSYLVAPNPPAENFDLVHQAADIAWQTLERRAQRAAS